MMNKNEFHKLYIFWFASMMNGHVSVSCIKYEYCKNNEQRYNK